MCRWAKKDGENHQRRCCVSHSGIGNHYDYFISWSSWQALCIHNGHPRRKFTHWEQQIFNYIITRKVCEVNGYGGSKYLTKLCNNGPKCKFDIYKGAKGILWPVEECITVLQ